jgi:NAD(P)-dependent dehydrogenase (short-subunit alcohol dehydrogenase family)
MRLDEGTTAVVTGAASGIGLALCRALAERGLNVVLVDRDEAGLAGAAATLSGRGRFVTAVADVSDPDSVTALAARVADELGPVHLLVNNAGILRPATVYEQPLADWHATFGVNVFGIIHGYRAFVPGMLAHGQPCHVLNTSSLGGLIAAPHVGAYMVSKHAAIALSEALAGDTAGTAMGVTVLCPGGVATDIFAAEQRRRQADGVEVSAADAERFSHIADPGRSDVLDPAVVAAIALESVERGDFYALAFPAGPRAAVRRRLATIEQALQSDEARTGALTGPPR